MTICCRATFRCLLQSDVQACDGPQMVWKSLQTGTATAQSRRWCLSEYAVVVATADATATCCIASIVATKWEAAAVCQAAKWPRASFLFLQVAYQFQGIFWPFLSAILSGLCRCLLLGCGEASLLGSSDLCLFPTRWCVRYGLALQAQQYFHYRPKALCALSGRTGDDAKHITEKVESEAIFSLLAQNVFAADKTTLAALWHNKHYNASELMGTTRRVGNVEKFQFITVKCANIPWSEATVWGCNSSLSFYQYKSQQKLGQLAFDNVYLTAWQWLSSCPVLGTLTHPLCIHCSRTLLAFDGCGTAATKARPSPTITIATAAVGVYKGTTANVWLWCIHHPTLTCCQHMDISQDLFEISC